MGSLDIIITAPLLLWAKSVLPRSSGGGLKGRAGNPRNELEKLISSQAVQTLRSRSDTRTSAQSCVWLPWQHGPLRLRTAPGRRRDLRCSSLRASTHGEFSPRQTNPSSKLTLQVGPWARLRADGMGVLPGCAHAAHPRRICPPGLENKQLCLRAATQCFQSIKIILLPQALHRASRKTGLRVLAGSPPLQLNAAPMCLTGKSGGICLSCTGGRLPAQAGAASRSLGTSQVFDVSSEETAKV